MSKHVAGDGKPLKLKKTHRVNGLQKLKDIVNSLDPVFRKKIIDSIEKENPVIAKFLDFFAFDFSIVLRLDPVSLQRLIGNVPDKNWIEAIGLASQDVKNYIFRQISTRRRDDWMEQSELFAKSQSPEVHKLASIKSQNLILGQMHKLLSRGQIRLLSKPYKGS